MILSTKSLVDAYKSEIGDLGEDGETSGTSPGFDRFVMMLIVAISLAISIIGVLGLYNYLLSANFAMSILSLFFAIAGVYSALGVYREFVSMSMISKLLTELLDETKKMEVMAVLLDKDRNLTLIDRLLGLVERIFSANKETE